MDRRETLAKARAARQAGKPTKPEVNLGVPQAVTLKRKAETPVSELDKVYYYQLCAVFPENWFPKEKKTGNLHKAPYPRFYVVPNEGIAYDADYIDPVSGKPSPRARKWRYIEGQPSIWNDEQPGLDMFDDKQIQVMLGEDANQLIFNYGQLNVRGIETLKRAALEVQDIFEGKERQYQPKNRAFRLLNPEKQLAGELELMDRQFKAEQMARECDTDRMIECAFVMGIDVSDLSDAGISRIRFEFLKKSKYDPKNPKGLEWFMEIMENPLTHVRYVFTTALTDGVLSATQQHNKLTWAAGNSAIMDLGTGDVVDQLCIKWAERDELTLKVLEEAEKQLFEIV